MATVKVLGVTDETTTCECCGKQNLKRVVVLDIDGNVVRYGCDCAARALTYRGFYAGQKVKPAAIWECAQWAKVDKARREMAGRHAETFLFQTR